MSKSEKLLIKKLKKPIKTPLNIRLCLKNIELNILKIRLKSELKEYQKQGADIRVKIEELDKNKPMFLEKRIGQKSVKILSESIVKLNTYMTILRTRKDTTPL